MRIRVNRIDCLAHGLCAELLPERIRVDERGNPILDDRELPLELVERARRASTRCPALALSLEPENVDPGVALSVALMP
jgi:ferredoxin